MKRIIIATFLVMGLTLSLVLLKPNSNYQKIEKEELKSSNLIGIYLKDTDEQEYHQVNEIPNEGNYALNTTTSYCLKPDNKENKIKDMLEYNPTSKTLSVSKLADNNTKCFLYFDKKKTSEEVLADLGLHSKGSINSFTGTACLANTNNKTHDADNVSGVGSCVNKNENGIYEAKDDYGTSYYYRGTIDNNWVKIGKEYWRIIRINGDGTIRLIYSGMELPTIEEGNGKWVKPGNIAKTNSNAIINQPYNTYTNDNKYVGFMYGVAKSGSESNETAPGITTSYEQAHTNNIKSDILQSIEKWYKESDLKNYEEFLDGTTGFCNDRELALNNHGDSRYTNLGYGKSATLYGAIDRTIQATSSDWGNAWTNPQTPSLICKNKKRDLFTTKDNSGMGNGSLDVPVGLITSDEAIFAGGFAGKINYGYWLYTGQYYWTLTPMVMSNNGYDYVFVVASSGTVVSNGVLGSSPSVRPVINLKSNTPFEPSNNNGDWGTISNPFLVKIN